MQSPTAAHRRETLPATPSWPPASTPRLYLDQPLADGATIVLDGPQAHYLGTVMRGKPGDPVRLFDDVSGEWLAELVDVARRTVTVRLTARLREREPVPDLWLCFAPIKKARLDWLIEKATELGVARLQPVVTQRTIVDRLNLDRLRAQTIEAAEQCDRTALPEIADPVKLPALLRDWPDRALLFADEQGGAPLAEAARPGASAILTGPEGGFTEDERAAIRAHPSAIPVSLGPRILRAETAALAAITVWMGKAGDWARSHQGD